MPTRSYPRTLYRFAKRYDHLMFYRVGTSAHPTLRRRRALVGNVEVEDILGKQKRRPHKLTPFAQVTGTCMTYPPQRGEQLGLDW